MEQDSAPFDEHDPRSAELLAELLEDQQRRWSRGERVFVEEYCRQHPGIPANKDFILDLIIHEVVLRESAGEQPKRDEYFQRFSQLIDELQLQFSLDDELKFSQTPDADLPPDVDWTLASDDVESLHRNQTTSAPAVSGTDRYEILKVLGRGGMAVVYLARDKRLNRLVALKVLIQRNAASGNDARRFLTEAVAVARLQHPNIVQVHEVGEYRGQSFLSFEYVDGGTLADRIRGRPLRPNEAARMLEQLARAVQFAHEHGILHRDLKPTNILIHNDDDHGSESIRTNVDRDAANFAAVTISDSLTSAQSSSMILKIADFGLAKIMDEEVDTAANPATMTGDILGTATYMSPEQARGTTRQFTAASDVYSLGAILYELLTGRPPFVGTKPLEVISQVLNDEPPRPSALVRRIPADIQTICLKCLEKNPLRRYASAASLADDLARFLGNEPIVARHTSAIERGWRWCRRHPATATFVGSVAALLISVSLITSGYSIRLSEQLTRTKSAQTAEAAANAQAMQRLLDSYISEANAQRTSGRAGQKFDGLKAIENASKLAVSSPDRMRAAAIGCLALPDLKSGEPWHKELAEYASESGKSLYINFDDQGDLVIRKMGSGMLVAQLSDLSPQSRLVLSPDETMLAVVHAECQVFLLGVTPARIVFRSPSQGCWNFLPDNQHIMGAVQDGTLTLFNIRSGAVVRTFGKGITETPIVFSRDCRTAACIASTSIRVLDLETGQTAAELKKPVVTPNAHPIAWHPDGNVLAAGLYPVDGVVLWDVSTGTKLQNLPQPAGELRLGFNSFGDLLLTQMLWEQQFTIWNVNSDRVELTLSDVGIVRFHADDEGNFDCLAVNTDNSYCKRTIEHAQVYRTLVRPKVQSNAAQIDLAFSPDGRFAAVASNGVIQFHRSSDWTRIGEIILGPSQLAFDPSGALLTWNQLGLNKWPVSKPATSNEGDADLDSNISFGPPIQLVSHRAYGLISVCRNGMSVAISNGNGALVWRAEDPANPLLFGPHLDARTVSINSQRRVVATGSWAESDVKVWDLESGRLSKSIPAGLYCELQFSPNGKWLATSAQKLRLWSVDTWRQTSESSKVAEICFSPDSSILAGSDWQGQVGLIDSETGETIATLSHPNQMPAARIAYTPDGRYLATLSRNGREVVQIWDLMKLRKELRTRGLDWSDSTAANQGGLDIEPPTENPIEAQPIAAVTIILDKRFQQLEARELARLAVESAKKNEIGAASAALHRSLQLEPQDADTCNSLAWLLAAGPDALRDTEQAVKLAQFATSHDSAKATYANTLGVALYRAARFSEAVTALESSLARTTPENQPFDLFFLTMCHARLGNPDRARETFDRARKLIDESSSAQSFEAGNELQQFAREAELELLAVSRSKLGLRNE